MPNPFDTIIPVFPNLIHCIKVDNFKDIQEDLINFVYEYYNLIIKDLTNKTVFITIAPSCLIILNRKDQ